MTMGRSHIGKHTHGSGGDGGTELHPDTFSLGDDGPVESFAELVAAGGGFGPAFEDTHDFSTGAYSIPSEEQEAHRVWVITNDSGSNPLGPSYSIGDLGVTASALDPVNGESIAGSTGAVAAQEITATNSEAEIQTIIRAYDYESG